MLTQHLVPPWKRGYQAQTAHGWRGQRLCQTDAHTRPTHTCTGKEGERERGGGGGEGERSSSGDIQYNKSVAIHISDNNPVSNHIIGCNCSMLLDMQIQEIYYCSCMITSK